MDGMGKGGEEGEGGATEGWQAYIHGLLMQENQAKQNGPPVDGIGKGGEEGEGGRAYMAEGRLSF